MELNYKDIGWRIGNARRRKGITQGQLAERTSMSASFVSYVESGKRSVSLENFVEVALALNVSADELLADALGNKIRSTSHEMLTLLSDCSDFEGRVLLGCMRGAKEEMRAAIAKMKSEVDKQTRTEGSDDS